MTHAAKTAPIIFARMSKISKYLPVFKFDCKISIRIPVVIEKTTLKRNALGFHPLRKFSLFIL